MTKLIRLSHTGIEYADYSWGIYSGCKNHLNGVCPVGEHCWARSITERFPAHYPDGFNPHIYPEALLSPLSLKKPSTITVGWVGDLIGYADPNMEIQTQRSVLSPDVWLTRKLRDILWDVILDCERHRFLFLTKNPGRLKLWQPFPSNCYVGVTVCNQEMMVDALYELAGIESAHKWLSIEPLLEDLNGGECEGKRLDGLKDAGISWCVIGGQSRPTVLPDISWVLSIVKACDKAGIPVWLKDNMVDLFEVNSTKGHIFFPTWATARGMYRQQLPDFERVEK